MAKISHLECTRCGERADVAAYERDLRGAEHESVCSKCGASSLLIRYDIAALRKSINRDALTGAPPTLWRYDAVLPVADDADPRGSGGGQAPPVSLGEGFTPLLPGREHPNVLIKDDALNPTGSFKSRGATVAVTMARAYGLTRLALPSAGNAGSALAAYAAAAGIKAFIFFPKDVPRTNVVQCRTHGAEVMLVDGDLGDCVRLIKERTKAERFLDFTRVSWPFRVEGKKTIGYEIAEQMGWTLPDAIIFPTSGGVGLIGIWKAIEEMQQLGWVPLTKHPKLIAVQPAGCAPLVKAWEEGKDTSETWPNPHTIAAGLLVARSWQDYLLLRILRATGGTAVAVSDQEILEALRHWASTEGIFAAPEGAATLAAYRRLLASGFLRESDHVVLCNTGSGLKYIDVIAEGHEDLRREAVNSRALGGIIQPY